MNTRLTGLGFHGSARRCNQSPSSAFDCGSSAVLPSMPAVSRPALTSVTRRTLNSALARERSINFCKFLALARSPCLRRREDALPQTPYVVLDLLPIDRQPVGDLVLRSVRRGDGRRVGLRRVCRLRCLGVQLVLRFRCRRALSLHRLTWPRQHPLGSGQPPVSGRLYGTRRRSGRPPLSRFPDAFRPPAFAYWPSCSRRGFGLPHGRPTGQHRCPELDGVPTFHTSEKQPGWAPPIPRGRWCPPG